MDLENNNSNGVIEESKQKTRPRDYWAQLDEFQGPLDILLHFVKEEELNIYDIPIAKITKDFLDYIDYMHSLDIEVAGEFLLMASELMKIKARMLLPSEQEEGEKIEEDPRLTLVCKLLEYKRFKDASIELSLLEDDARKQFFRRFYKYDEKHYEYDITEDYSLKNLTVYNLISNLKQTLLNLKPGTIHPIELLTVSPEIQREFLLEFLQDRSEVSFSELIENMDEKLLIICTFLAILQLVLEGILKIEIIDKPTNFKIIKFT